LQNRGHNFTLIQTTTMPWHPARSHITL
jgi:hypothetical protein